MRTATDQRGQRRVTLGVTTARRRAVRGGIRALALLVALAVWRPRSMAAQGGVRLDGGRFTVVAEAADARLARTLLAAAQAQDSFPGLPRSTQRVLIAIAPDAARMRAWSGGAVPEWGAAFALPEAHRVVVQGRAAGSDAGDPRVTLRHELAHLALHDVMGRLPPRWFDEGYAGVAAGEWDREAALETAVGLIWRTVPTRDAIEAGFSGGGSSAAWSYAMAYRVVAELEALDPVHGLEHLFTEWRASGSLDVALRRAYGMTSEQFDAHWRGQTRRRYGALSLIAALSFVGGLFGVVLGPLFWVRRRRDQRRLAQLRAADAIQEAREAEAAMQAALLAVPEPATGGVPAPSPESLPRRDL